MREPTKAAYKDFAADPDAEFEFFLADRLRMLVDELRERMPNDEYVRWHAYHARRAQARELAAKTGRG